MGSRFPRFSTSPEDFPRSRVTTLSFSSSSRDFIIWLYTDDCGGITCALFTWVLLLYSEFVMFYYVSPPSRALYEWHLLHPSVNEPASSPSPSVSLSAFLLFTLLIFLSLAHHLVCMTTDPGVIPRCRPPLSTSSLICNRSPCNGSYKPPRAHHSNDLGRCVKRFDHVCPWTNAAIGLVNLKHFMLFCLFVFLSSVLAILLIFSKYVSCPSYNIAKCFDSGILTTIAHDNRLDDSISMFGMLNCLIVLMIALLFGIFTCIMFGSQIYALASDQTQIEQWKAEKDRGLALRARKPILISAGKTDKQLFRGNRTNQEKDEKVTEEEGRLLDSFSESESASENEIDLEASKPLRPLPDSSSVPLSFLDNLFLTFLGDHPSLRSYPRWLPLRILRNFLFAVLPIPPHYADYDAVLGVAGLERLELNQSIVSK
jgi:hypothetical protein